MCYRDGSGVGYQMESRVSAAAAAVGFSGLPAQNALQPVQLTAPQPPVQQQQQQGGDVSRTYAVQRMASLQQQMLAMTSQLQQLQSIVAGMGPAAAAADAQAGSMQQNMQQQQQMQQMQMGRAVLLPQLSNVSTVSSTLQHPAWMM
jgi:hypothetical protein